MLGGAIRAVLIAGIPVATVRYLFGHKSGVETKVQI